MSGVNCYPGWLVSRLSDFFESTVSHGMTVNELIHWGWDRRANHCWYKYGTIDYSPPYRNVFVLIGLEESLLISQHKRLAGDLRLDYRVMVVRGILLAEFFPVGDEFDSLQEWRNAEEVWMEQVMNEQFFEGFSG